jgi:subtilisin family serine protease
LKHRLAIATPWIAALLLAIGSHAPSANAEETGAGPQSANEIRYIKGRLLVQPRAGLSDREFDNILGRHGARRIDVIRQINVHIIELPEQANEQAVARALARNRHIKFAEVDRVVPPALTPNDPSYGNGWHLPKIGSPVAWNSTAGEGITIAVLDSGVDPAHPDLVDNLVPGYNFFNNNADSRDVYGHGTKVAGAAAMAGNNFIGGAGVAFASKVMPIRVTDTSGYGSYSLMAKGITWAADRGARVASMSFLHVCGSSTILSAAQYMRNKSGIVTGSAGNTGAEVTLTPSDLITCVSATDKNDARASWSSYGSYVDVAAPGVSIYTTTNGGGYGSVSGTSFSAPVTGAVYALMMAANPALAPSQLDEALFSTAVDLGSAGKDPYYGHGRVDAGAAVASVRVPTPSDTTAPSVAITSPATGTDVYGVVLVDVSASDNVGVTRVDLYAGGVLVGSETGAPYAFSWDTAVSPDGPVMLEARAFDAAGNVAAAEVSVTVANTAQPIADRTPPIVTILSPASGTLVVGPMRISVSASDDTGVNSIELSINGRPVAVSSGSALTFDWDPYAGVRGIGQMKKIPGPYTITAVVSDEAGNAASTSVFVTVE